MAAGDRTNVKDDHDGNYFRRICNVEGPASYAAGGFLVNRFGFHSVDLALFAAVLQDTDEAMIAHYDEATDKVRVFQAINAADALREVADATNLAAFVFKAMVLGQR